MLDVAVICVGHCLPHLTARCVHMNAPALVILLAYAHKSLNHTFEALLSPGARCRSRGQGVGRGGCPAKLLSSLQNIFSHIPEFEYRYRNKDLLQASVCFNRPDFPHQPAKRSYLFCAFLTAQSGRPCTGGAPESLALPKALSRSGMPFSSRRRGPISAPRLATSPTASRPSLMSGMLRKGLHSHCRSSLLPPAGHTHTHSQPAIYFDSRQGPKHFPVEVLF